MSLLGTTPPAPPANGVCLNGIYYFSSGQDARTPNIASLNTSDFQFQVDFNITGLPANVAPVLMGGNSYRWLGIYLQANGTVGMKHNNSNLAWSTTTLTPGIWYTGLVRYEGGTAELLINGITVMQVNVGVLNTGNNLIFTTNDYSNGRAFNGCIRNLSIANDTTLGAVASATNYGAGCDGLALDASGLPTVGNPAFALAVSSVPVVSPFAFAAFGTTATYPGLDLGFLGMTGCASYTSFDLGLFGPAVVSAGTGVFPLPIPNSSALAGSALAAQGVSLSVATAFGLATSNGTQLVIGL